MLEVVYRHGVRLEFATRQQPKGEQQVFRDQRAAHAFLTEHVSDKDAVRALRRLLTDEADAQDSSGLNDHDVLAELSWALVSGRVGVARTNIPAAGGRAKRPSGPKPVPVNPDPPQPKPNDDKIKAASVTMDVADPAMVDVDRDSKGQKLTVTLKTIDDTTKKAGTFDGTLTLKALSGGDRIKVLDGGKELKLPATLKGAALKSTLRLTVKGQKASDALDDIELEAKIEKTGKTNLGAQTTAKGKLTVVDLRAEDGKADPPHVVPIKNELTTKPKAYKVKIKAVPDLKGTWKWTTKSTKLTIEDAAKQMAVIVAKDKPSSKAKAETITLEAAPSGKKSIKLTHKIGGAQVTFSQDKAHAGGYDAYEKIPGLDGNGDKTSEQPDPKHDIMCIEKGKDGTVKFSIKGATEKDIFFTSDKAGRAKPKTEQPTATSGTHTITAGNVNKKETVINARVGSAKGPIVAKLGVVVFKKVTYKAEFFRVKDSKSADTSLDVASVTGVTLSKDAKVYYDQAIAELKITGGAAVKDVPYDSTAKKSTKNGALDLEPGKTSAEEKILSKACRSKKSRAVYIHKLRWSYYFAADAKAKDKTIKLKKYGSTYLGYIGTKQYTISDTDGNTETVTVKSVNKSTGVVTLAAGLTNSYKKKSKAALIWPLGGLSGNPVWVSDVGSKARITNFVVHELGHQVAGWNDVCELNNFMHGGSAAGALLRHRPIKKYYKTAKTERQWMKMKGR